MTDTKNALDEFELMVEYYDCNRSITQDGLNRLETIRAALLEVDGLRKEKEKLIAKLYNEIYGIRAELVNKPALDAEVREAWDSVERSMFVYHKNFHPDEILATKEKFKMLRAASAVQEPEEVTVDDLVRFIGGGAAKTLCYLYPNGFKIAKEK